MNKNKIIEIVKKALLKQLHKVRYVANGYPIEAVPKATILGLDALIGSELASLYSGDVSERLQCPDCDIQLKYTDGYSSDPQNCTDPHYYCSNCKFEIQISLPNEHHPTPEISEEEIEEGFDEYTFCDEAFSGKYSGHKQTWFNAVKWAISKGTKPISEKPSDFDRLSKLEEAFNTNKVDKSELIQYGLGLGEFLRAVKELNKQ